MGTVGVGFWPRIADCITGRKSWMINSSSSTRQARFGEFSQSSMSMSVIRTGQGWKELKNLEGWTLAACFDKLAASVFDHFWLCALMLSLVVILKMKLRRTGLKALYGECNAFDRISGLSLCRNLRSLFLQAWRIMYSHTPRDTRTHSYPYKSPTPWIELLISLWSAWKEQRWQGWPGFTNDVSAAFVCVAVCLLW